jgi:hypothetical protein
MIEIIQYDQRSLAYDRDCVINVIINALNIT